MDTKQSMAGQAEQASAQDAAVVASIPNVEESRPLPANVNAGALSSSIIDEGLPTIDKAIVSKASKAKQAGKASKASKPDRTSISSDGGATWHYQPVSELLDFRPSAYGNRAERRAVKAQAAKVAASLNISHTFKNDATNVYHLDADKFNAASATKTVSEKLPQGWKVTRAVREGNVWGVYVKPIAPLVYASSARSRMTRHQYSGLTDKDFQNDK